MAATDDWDPVAVSAALDAYKYTEVMAALDGHMEAARDPRAVNWCVDVGYRRGNVPVLYRLVRNIIKFQVGRVPTLEDVAFGMRCALLLLLRVAQDVRCCRDDLGRQNLEFVYAAIRDKIGGWIGGFGGGPRALLLPSPAKVADDLAAWSGAEEAAALPLPAWPTTFATSRILGTTFFWGDPTSHTVECFRRNATIGATRSAVIVSFLTFLRNTPSWDAILKADFDAVVGA